MRAFQLACNTVWAITEEALDTILTIAARENLPLEAVEALRGEKLDNTHTVTVRDGVSTIPVEGPIFRRADMFTRISGATSIDTLATDFRAALDDPAIHSIVFAVDSPGGEVNGVAEFADMVYAARGQKPMTAYISDLGASAAYWIASAADEVVVAATAAVGSIGVVCAVPDPRSTSARTVEFVSSDAPNKRPNVATTAGRAQVQELVDATTEIFVNAVARNRGVTAAVVRADFGGGGILMGQAAVRAGLADRVASYEDVLATAVVRYQATQTTTGRRAASPKGAEMDKGFWRNVFQGAQEAGAMHDDDGDDTTLVRGGAGVVPARLRGMVTDEEYRAQQAETERLRAELAAERERNAAAQRRRIDADAAAFAETHIRAGKLGVPQREAVIADYTQRATDDAAHPLEGTSRVAQLTALYAGAPATAPQAGYIGEQIAAGQYTALGNQGSADEARERELAAVEANARQWAERANGRKG